METEYSKHLVDAQFQHAAPLECNIPHRHRSVFCYHEPQRSVFVFKAADLGAGPRIYN